MRERRESGGENGGNPEFSVEFPGSFEGRLRWKRGLPTMWKDSKQQDDLKTGTL